ncbi:hypothetical protein EB796_016337 [Bugula neritina]|uniref:Uncharacterized protein n=1 Tax=Bugula neritina TaxID=10212 RepID=A0A7J7JGI8_BUGNE|nr:hypothetical protein EB796_016337 [Bugula neritina]
MRNAAIACLILVVLILFVSIITALIGLIANQVICLLITGIMFFLAAFYTLLALIVMHVKINKEMKTCSTFTEIPLAMCECYTMYPDWSLYVAWMSAILFSLTFLSWWKLSSLISNNST